MGWRVEGLKKWRVKGQAIQDNKPKPGVGIEGSFGNAPYLDSTGPLYFKALSCPFKLAYIQPHW